MRAEAKRAILVTMYRSLLFVAIETIDKGLSLLLKIKTNCWLAGMCFSFHAIDDQLLKEAVAEDFWCQCWFVCILNNIEDLKCQCFFFWYIEH